MKGRKKKDKSTLAYYGLGNDEPEVNLLSRLCWYGVRFLRLLRTVLFLRRELKDKCEIAASLPASPEGYAVASIDVVGEPNQFNPSTLRSFDFAQDRLLLRTNGLGYDAGLSVGAGRNHRSTHCVSRLEAATTVDKRETNTECQQD